MDGALVSEVRSALAPRKMLKVKSVGPTIQEIAGGVKQSLKNIYSLKTMNPKPLNLNPKSCTAIPQP
jgi:hypothetical protein